MLRREARRLDREARKATSREGRREHRQMSFLQPCDLAPRAFPLKFYQGASENVWCHTADMHDKITTEKTTNMMGDKGQAFATKLQVEDCVTDASRVFNRSFFGTFRLQQLRRSQDMFESTRSHTKTKTSSAFFRILFFLHCPSPSARKYYPKKS